MSALAAALMGPVTNVHGPSALQCPHSETPSFTKVTSCVCESRCSCTTRKPLALSAASTRECWRWSGSQRLMELDQQLSEREKAARDPILQDAVLGALDVDLEYIEPAVAVPLHPILKRVDAGAHRRAQPADLTHAHRHVRARLRHRKRDRAIRGRQPLRGEAEVRRWEGVRAARHVSAALIVGSKAQMRSPGCSRSSTSSQLQSVPMPTL